MLATDTDEEIRELAALNPLCPRTVLAQLANDKDPDVRRAAQAAIDEPAQP